MINIPEAIYYAVREDLNADVVAKQGEAGHRDKKNDALIREAIRIFDNGYLETCKERFSRVELESIARAAWRRNIPLTVRFCQQIDLFPDIGGSRHA